MDSAQSGLLQTIREKKTMDDQLKGQLNGILKEFKERFVSKHKESAVTA
jgi:F0F1-type ATP synthase alpha subunit